MAIRSGKIFNEFSLGFISPLDVDTTKVPSEALADVRNFEINNPLLLLKGSPGFEIPEEYGELPPWSGSDTIGMRVWSVERPSPKDVLILVRKSKNILLHSEFYLGWEDNGGVTKGDNVQFEVDNSVGRTGINIESGASSGYIEKGLDVPDGTNIQFSMFTRSNYTVTLRVIDSSGSDSISIPSSGNIWVRNSVTRTVSSNASIRVELDANNNVDIYGPQVEIKGDGDPEDMSEYGYTTNTPNPNYIWMFPRWDGSDWVNEWTEITEQRLAVSGNISNNVINAEFGVPDDYLKGWQLSVASEDISDLQEMTIVGNTSTNVTVISTSIGPLRGLYASRSPVMSETNLNNIDDVRFTEALGRLYISFGKERRPFVLFYHNKPARFNGLYPSINSFILDYQTHFFPILRQDNLLSASNFERFGMEYSVDETTIGEAVAASGKLIISELPDPPPGLYKPVPFNLRIGSNVLGFDLFTESPEDIATGVNALSLVSATHTGDRSGGTVEITAATAGADGNNILFSNEDGTWTDYVEFVPDSGTLEGGLDTDSVEPGDYYIHLVITLENGTKLLYREAEPLVVLSTTKSLEITISLGQVGFLSRINRIEGYIGDTEDYISMYKQFTLTSNSEDWDVDGVRLKAVVVLSKLKEPLETTTMLQDMFRNPNLEVRSRFDNLHYLGGRIFVSNIPENPNFVRFSNIRGITEEVDIFPFSESEGFGYIYTDPGASDEIRALGTSIDGNLMIFRGAETSIYEVSSGREFQRRFFVLFKGIGVAHQNALVEQTDFGSFWYDERGMYWYRGGISQPERIDVGRVSNYFKQFREYINDSFAVFNHRVNEYWIFVRKSESDYEIIRFSPLFNNFNIMSLDTDTPQQSASVTRSGDVLVSTRKKILEYNPHGNSKNLKTSIAHTHKIRIGTSRDDKQLDELFIEGNSPHNYTMQLFINDEVTTRHGNSKTILNTLRRWVRSIRAFSRVSKFSVRIESTDDDDRPEISEFGVIYTSRRDRYGSR